jgi:hypothetical protein
MINTISLCPVCYKKIEATLSYEDNLVVMRKECNVHGKFEAIVEKDASFFGHHYQYGTLGKNNTIILNMSNSCNMKCNWCYYDKNLTPEYGVDYYHQLLHVGYRGFNWLLSGGEPTVRSDYFDFIKQAYDKGWQPSTITNMINLGNPDFFRNTLNQYFVSGNNSYMFSMSMHHPKHYSGEVYNAKLMALKNIESTELKAHCVMFSIQSLDELQYIRSFYNDTKSLYRSIRIRTMFNNWNNEGEKDIYLSELYRAAMYEFRDLSPVISTQHEISTPYAIYLELSDGGFLSLTSSPTAHNIDYNLCARPVYMLGVEGRCYSVPICLIVNEGIQKGYKDGYRIQPKGDKSCM